MTGEEIALALGDLPDDLIQGAMESGGRTSPIPGVAKRLVACIAILITVVSILFWSSTLSPNVVEAEGLITITGYSDDGTISFPLNKGVSTPGLNSWNAATSIQPGLQVRLFIDSTIYDNTEITFDVFTTNGSIIVKEKNTDPINSALIPYGDTFIIMPPSQHHEENVFSRGKSFTVNNYTTLFWNNISEDSNSVFKGKHAFLNVIVYADDNIVGFSVIRLSQTNTDSLSYSAKLIESISFPKENNTFQNIPYSYVIQRIQEVMSRHQSSF